MSVKQIASIEKNIIKDSNLLGADAKTLKELFVKLDEKSFRATQTLKWIHQQGVVSFAEMKNLSENLRDLLDKNYELTAPKLLQTHTSSDGTIKWLMEVDNKKNDIKKSAIETVFIPEENRGTLCISSQVGCALECVFCATAQQGFNRNLTASEIIAQVWMANRQLEAHHKNSRRITNVVFMGMGEPLLNLTHVLPAIDILLDDNAYGLSKRRVTVSTSGVVPAIDILRDKVDIALAVSLHAPNNALRNELVPINKKYPIEELMQAIKNYLYHDESRKRHVVIEYVMLDGINDSNACAKELAVLLKGLTIKVNLIPFNPFENSIFKQKNLACSSKKRIYDFASVLMQNNILCTTRKTRGDDISAACGQLSGQVVNKSLKRSNIYEQEISSITKRIKYS